MKRKGRKVSNLGIKKMEEADKMPVDYVGIKRGDWVYISHVKDKTFALKTVLLAGEVKQ